MSKKKKKKFVASLQSSISTIFANKVEGRLVRGKCHNSAMNLKTRERDSFRNLCEHLTSLLLVYYTGSRRNENFSSSYTEILLHLLRHSDSNFRFLFLSRVFLDDVTKKREENTKKVWNFTFRTHRISDPIFFFFRI